MYNDYPPSPSMTYASRLPQPPSSPAADHSQRGPTSGSNGGGGGYSPRTRRQSVISMQPSPSTTPKPERHARSRTMSDAGHSGLPRVSRTSNGINSNGSNRTDLRRSVLTTTATAASSKSSSSDEEDDEDGLGSSRRYRASAPLLNAYGIPISQASAMKARASMGALRFASQQQQSGANVSTAPELPPSDLNQKIRVCVRKRPLSKKDLERAEKDIINTIGTRSIKINEPK